MFYRCLGFLASSNIRLIFLIICFLSINSYFSSTLLAETQDNSSDTSNLSGAENGKKNNHLKEIRVFCSTVLSVDELQKKLPKYKIDSQSYQDFKPKDGAEEQKASFSALCPQQKQIITIKPTAQSLITEIELESIAEIITELYKAKGYYTSSASKDRLIKDNVGRIEVNEDKVEVITVEGTKRLKKYVRSRVELATNPLNQSKLEDQLRLLKADPLFKNIEATLQLDEPENTKLIIRVTEASPISGIFGIDNYSPPSVGGEKFNLGLAYRNLAGLGDELAVAYSPRLQNMGGTYDLDFSYQIPINSMNGTIQLKTNINRNEVIQGEFKDFDIRGESERYAINYRQPLIRKSSEELALSLGFDYRDGQTFTFQGPIPFGFGPDEDGVSRTSVLSFGHDYTKRDKFGNGAWSWRSQLRWGVGIFGATENDSPIPDGKFISFLTQLQRVQVLNDSNFLIIQTDFQATPDALLPFEKFPIGGGQSVRGYRQNVRSGDNGVRFSIEDRLTLARNHNGNSVFVLAPFVDLGYVWNVAGNPNVIPEQRFIIGVGLGLLLQPIEGLNLRLDYAPPLIDLKDRGDDIQDDGLYFSVGYNF